MYSVQLITHLNTLIQTCKDSATGFAQCADISDNAMLKAALTQNYRHCSASAGELDILLSSLGGNSALNSTLAATRRWPEVKASASENDEEAIVQTYERSLEVALSSYQNVLSQHLPEYVRIIVSRQMAGLQVMSNEIKNLLNSLYASA